MTRTRIDTCRNCGSLIPEIEARRLGRIGLCEPCRDKHIAAWKEEHTRKSGIDPRSGWLIGDRCRVKLGKIEYTAKILDMSDNAGDNFFWTKLELTKTVQAFGMPLTQTWIHPEPVQSYKLRKSWEEK